ncbi:MAG: MBL fold metallo-hydrolase [Eubacteriales bacterium]|nr:MBL fold metallo-hydrolase [Clostridiales bacterium]MDD7307139.1 MBL fold metallo-hydrolase [Eubacteriales bacterium]MDY2932870.1 MBL fold metallo-hydrolase [Anaerovoracaceae bacterium]
MKIVNIPTGMLQANTYLVCDETSRLGFIVDLGGYSKELKNIIEKNDIQIQYIVLTHGHGDHIGGVQEHLKDFPDAKVVCSRAEEKMLLDPELNEAHHFGPEKVSFKPDILVDDGDTLTVGNMTMKFIMTPGHTEGGMCILIDDVLFSGDTLFCRSIGRTDLAGGDFRTIMESIKKKLFLLPDETQVLPGHMGPTTIGFEKENNPFV